MEFKAWQQQGGGGGGGNRRSSGVSMLMLPSTIHPSDDMSEDDSVYRSAAALGIIQGK